MTGVPRADLLAHAGVSKVCQLVVLHISFLQDHTEIFQSPRNV